MNLSFAAYTQELAKGGKVQALTEAVNALEKELVKTKTQLDISEGTVKDEGKRVEAAKKAVKEVRVFDDSRSQYWRSGSVSSSYRPGKACRVPYSIVQP